MAGQMTNIRKLFVQLVFSSRHLTKKIPKVHKRRFVFVAAGITGFAVSQYYTKGKNIIFSPTLSDPVAKVCMSVAPVIMLLNKKYQ